jgi:general secretion pathway protein G
MRKGFTMIELIFVIVILGILAAVAIPRLTATRDDAQIARGASDIATAINDFGSYYTARGQFDAVTDMTNVDLNDADGDDNLTNGGMFYTVNGDNCIEFQTSAVDGNLTVSSESNTSAICQGINNAVQDLVRVHRFGGSGVVW